MIKQILKRYMAVVMPATPITQDLTQDDVVVKEGIYYNKFTDVPITGSVEGDLQGAFNDGKQEGRWNFYYENGKVKIQGNFNDGKIRR